MRESMSLKQPKLPGPDNSLGSGFHFQLGIDSTRVGFHRVQGNMQLVSYFLV